MLKEIKNAILWILSSIQSMDFLNHALFPSAFETYQEFSTALNKSQRPESTFSVVAIMAVSNFTLFFYTKGGCSVGASSSRLPLCNGPEACLGSTPTGHRKVMFYRAEHLSESMQCMSRDRSNEAHFVNPATSLHIRTHAVAECLIPRSRIRYLVTAFKIPRKMKEIIVLTLHKSQFALWWPPLIVMYPWILENCTLTLVTHKSNMISCLSSHNP